MTKTLVQLFHDGVVHLEIIENGGDLFLRVRVVALPMVGIRWYGNDGCCFCIFGYVERAEERAEVKIDNMKMKRGKKAQRLR